MSTSADAGNHLLGYSYDAGGNMTSDGVNTYVYDGENRVSSVAGVSYTYDADGRRVKKSSGTNYWYGPSGEAMAETDSAGTWTNYVFFGGIRLARNVNGDIKYYITDHLHSTAVFADKSGTVLDDNDFYPWGGVVPGVGQTTSNNTIKFTGKYRDTESGLDYFGARYYGNVMGRFMSPDWADTATAVRYADFGDPQSLNLYSYVRNSPVIRVDADGHDFVNEGFQDWGFDLGDSRWGLGPAPEGDQSQQVQQKPQQQQQSPQTQQVTITYDKGVPAMQPKTEKYVRDISQAAGLTSINISATTNGKHARHSNHYNGTAADINKINGRHVRDSGKDPALAAAVRSLQSAANNPKNGVAHENYGPAGLFKEGKRITNQKLQLQHENHVHITIPRNNPRNTP